MWQLSTLNTAFKEAVNSGVVNIKDGLDNFLKLKRDEAAILSQQTFYLQALSDIIIDDSDSYENLIEADVRRHKCQGRIHPMRQFSSTLAR